ncbi:hypothetical protein [Duganella sp. Root1480D1]|uniref:hypothetical protein n=1 Tax=Duganella sp. Root1480D1 TaxID=1736471 RepID=UPI00070BA367|nr:hypothetical protein [Duganella sp. Root1480D1]KQZ39526.1 hypothetical protein ASD58_03760 [Duganella sp. Root1480D1]
MKLRHLSIAGLLTALQMAAHAGSPGGLQLVVLGTSGAADYRVKVEQFFSAYETDPTGFDCDNRQLNIESTVQKPLKAITADVASVAATDTKKRRSFSKTISKYRDRDHDRGFDGALLYDVINGKLVFYGISAWDKEPIQKVELSASESDDKRKFNLAICRALHMPVLQAP